MAIYEFVTMTEDGMAKVQTDVLQEYLADNDTEITGYAISKRLRPELQDQPKVSGFNGPCWGGFSQFGEPIIRYEDDETYRQLSQ